VIDVLRVPMVLRVSKHLDGSLVGRWREDGDAKARAPVEMEDWST
jgi:hypothetical protein